MLSHCNTARLCLLRGMFNRSVPPGSLFIAALMPTKARNQEPRHRLVSQANIAANLEDSGNETTLVCFASLRKFCLAQIMNSGSLVLYAPPLQSPTTATYLLDYSGNGNNCTFASSAHAPNWMANGALNFSGSSGGTSCTASMAQPSRNNRRGDQPAQSMTTGEHQLLHQFAPCPFGQYPRHGHSDFHGNRREHLDCDHRCVFASHLHAVCELGTLSNGLVELPALIGFFTIGRVRNCVPS